MSLRKTKKNKDSDVCENKFCKEYVKRGVKSALLIGEAFTKALAAGNLVKDKKFDSASAIKKMKSKKSMDKIKKRLTKVCKSCKNRAYY
jgi:hypothetical protein